MMTFYLRCHVYAIKIMAFQTKVSSNSLMLLVSRIGICKFVKYGPIFLGPNYRLCLNPFLILDYTLTRTPFVRLFEKPFSHVNTPDL